MSDRNIDKETWVLVEMVVAILACVGTVVAAVIGILPDIAVSLATQTPTAALVAPQVPTTSLSTGESGLKQEDTPVTTVNIDEVLSNILSGTGGIEAAAPWWKVISVAREDGTYDPTAFPGAEGCFGVTWNVLGLDHTVVVFQSAQVLDFQAGGHYSLICLTRDVALSATDVGRIQAEWLSKEHGGTWRVQVLD